MPLLGILNNCCIYSNKDKNFKANHNYQKCNGDYCMLYL